MILVSYSLYGNDPKYLIGALKNAELVKEFGHEWKAIFYLGMDVPREIEEGLLERDSIIRRCEKHWHPNGMFWRFFALQEFDFDFAVIRDVDSRITQRELVALQEWFLSGKTLHIMRDHPFHNARIMGGMWGVTSKIKESKIDWEKINKYGSAQGEDQRFLEKEIYPVLKESAHIHDSIFECFYKRSGFPSERNGLEYVGESLDENDFYDDNLRRVLDSYLKSPFFRLKILTTFLVHKFGNFLH